VLRQPLFCLLQYYFNQFDNSHLVLLTRESHLIVSHHFRNHMDPIFHSKSFLVYPHSNKSHQTRVC